MCARFVIEKSTRSRDPSNSSPSNRLFASSASASFSIVMKQNPRERPLPRSRTTLHDSTLPYFSNKLFTSRSCVYTERPKTPRQFDTGGFSRSPTCRLRFDIGDLLSDLDPRDLDRDLERDRDAFLFCTGLRDREQDLERLFEGLRSLLKLRDRLLDRDRDSDRDRDRDRAIMYFFLQRLQSFC